MPHLPKLIEQILRPLPTAMPDDNITISDIFGSCSHQWQLDNQQNQKGTVRRKCD